MKLRECPFCGGEVTREFDGGEPIIHFHHDDDCFLADEQTMHDCPRAEEAWNRRAERTCHEDWVPGSVGGTSVPVCSNCGRGWEAAEVYCANCGAKVVDE